MTSPIFDEESFFSDGGFDDFLGEIQEVGNRPWEIASLEKKLRVIFLMIMIIIGLELELLVCQEGYRIISSCWKYKNIIYINYICDTQLEII